MGLKFNPPKEFARYAVFLDYNGQGTFKTYDKVGTAKNVVQAKDGYTNAKILENVGGDWYVLYDIDPKAEHKPWHKVTTRGGWRSSYKYWRGVPMTREEYGDWRAKVERERVLAERKTFVA